MTETATKRTPGQLEFLAMCDAHQPFAQLATHDPHRPSLFIEPGPPVEDDRAFTRDEIEAIAERLVLCWNTRDLLVEALQRCVTAAGSYHLGEDAHHRAVQAAARAAEDALAGATP